MVFHCLSVPYSPTRKDVSLCAFVQKVYKFCDEMTKRGHTVYHYGHENSIVNCTEHINVTNNDILINSYGNLNDWKTKGFDQNVNTKAVNVFKNFTTHNIFFIEFKTINTLIFAFFIIK